MLEKKLPRGQRLLNGLAGVRLRGRLKAPTKLSDLVSVEMSVSDVAMIP
jgi:hypothetical protein